MAKKVNWKIVVSCIIAIALLEGYALYQGIDGTLFSIVIAAIAGLGGYTIKNNNGK